MSADAVIQRILDAWKEREENQGMVIRSWLTRRCPICDNTATNITSALWSHLRPIDLSRDNFTTARGTFQMFGFVSVICNFSPLFNCLWNWSARKKRLVLPDKFDGSCSL